MERKKDRGHGLLSYRHPSPRLRRASCLAVVSQNFKFGDTFSWRVAARNLSLCLSRYIIANKADYYRLLFAVTRDGAWAPW